MAAEEIVLPVGDGGVVRVGGGSETELVRVEALGALHREPVLERLPGVAADDVRDAPRRIAQEHRHDLEAGELVVGRKQRMRLRRAFELVDLDQPLVAIARSGIGGVDRTALGVDLDREHPAVGEVRVVRDGEELVAGLALAIHPVPEIHGVKRVQCAERLRRYLSALLEEDVAMQVHVIRHRGPFVRAERREFPRLVRLVSHLDDFFPDASGDLRGHQRLDRWTSAQVIDDVQGELLHVLLRPGLQDQRLRCGELADRRARIVRQLHDAGVFGVVGDAGPVERRVDLDVVAQRMLDRLALEVFVGVGRRRHDVSKAERVERPACVDVRLAEVGVPVGVGLRGGCRCGGSSLSKDRPGPVRRVARILLGLRAWRREVARESEEREGGQADADARLTKRRFHLNCPLMNMARAAPITATSPCAMLALARRLLHRFARENVKVRHKSRA